MEISPFEDDEDIHPFATNELETINEGIWKVNNQYRDKRINKNIFIYVLPKQWPVKLR